MYRLLNGKKADSKGDNEKYRSDLRAKMGDIVTMKVEDDQLSFYLNLHYLGVAY